MTQRFFRIFFLIGGLLMLLPAPVVAATPLPQIHKPEGKKCVQPEAEMRRNHMNYILHQRDKTVHEGIRSETQGEAYSLAKCIDCHVEPNASGEIASAESKEHFCNGCHEYASVQIDCFECHADKPQKYIQRDKKAATLKQELHNMLASEGSRNE